MACLLNVSHFYITAVTTSGIRFFGCPSFVSEESGDGIAQEPQALEDIQTYSRNVAVWLAGR